MPFNRSSIHLTINIFFRAATILPSSGAFEPTQEGAAATASGSDPYAFDGAERASEGQPSTSAPQLSEARLRMLSTLVSRAFQERRVEQLSIPEVSPFFLLPTAYTTCFHCVPQNLVSKLTLHHGE